MRCLSRTTNLRHTLSQNARPLQRNVFIEGPSRLRISAAFSNPRHRAFSLSSVPAVLLPPLVFTGLVISLWTYKCLMMIIFQNKIIYMPSVPPFSRSEKVKDYAVQSRPVVWKEHDLKAQDGVALKLLEGRIDRGSTRSVVRKQVVVLYFQGNASSLPPRLPYLSSVLKAFQPSTTTPNKDIKDDEDFAIFALSYRGFWTSRGRATQPGLELDAQAALAWLSQHLLRDPHHLLDTRFALWGQSIGAGVATKVLATHLASSKTHPSSSLPIHALILETPFPSIRTMLTTIYPQKFLPYRYLWPFLRSTWDSEAAIRSIARSISKSLSTSTSLPQHAFPLPSHPLRKILILQAGKDELVPAAQSEALERVCRAELADAGTVTGKRTMVQVEVERVVVDGALHTEVMARLGGREAVVRCLRGVAGGGGGGGEEGGQVDV